MVKRKELLRPKIKINIIGLIPLLIILGLIWYFRPWFHSTFMFFYTNPIFIEVIVVWFVIHKLFLGSRKRSRQFLIEGMETPVDTAPMMKFFTSIFVLLLLLSGTALFTSLMPQLHLVNELEYNKINELPETKENIRLMPFEVAYRFSRDSLQLSQYKLGTENIALINGSMAWMFPLIPDGTVIQFTLKNKGMVYVDATTQERNSQLVEKSLQTGEGMQIFDNLWWNLYKKKYRVDLDFPYYVVYNDDVYAVVSVISYSFHNYFGLLYTVPRFEGVFLVDSNGDMDFLTPEQAKDNPVISGNRILPENLARYYTEVYKYHKGVINRFVIHEDQIEVRDVPTFARSNKQPYLMSTDEGLKWFISTEPSGESRGVFKIFLIDAITGRIELFELSIEETLTGPVRATDFVRRANPLVDWTRFKIVEPLPFITDSVLYWKVVVIPNDAAGIAYQAFVNSKTNDVVQADTDADVVAFVQSGIIVEEPVKEETREGTVKEIKEKLKELEGLVQKLE